MAHLIAIMKKSTALVHQSQDAVREQQKVKYTEQAIADSIKFSVETRDRVDVLESQVQNLTGLLQASFEYTAANDKRTANSFRKLAPLAAFATAANKPDASSYKPRKCNFGDNCRSKTGEGTCKFCSPASAVVQVPASKPSRTPRCPWSLEDCAKPNCPVHRAAVASPEQAPALAAQAAKWATHKS